MSSPLEILNPSIADVRRAEEQEREERLQAGDNRGTVNAYKVAELVKLNKKTLIHLNGGKLHHHHLSHFSNIRLCLFVFLYALL